MDVLLLIHGDCDEKQSGKRLLSRKLAAVYGLTEKQKLCACLTWIVHSRQ
jgi:hypothetical protein